MITKEEEVWVRCKNELAFSDFTFKKGEYYRGLVRTYLEAPGATYIFFPFLPFFKAVREGGYHFSIEDPYLNNLEKILE